MKKIYNPAPETWEELLKRPIQTFEAIEQTVTSIFTEVQRSKNKAVQKYTSLFDGVSIENLLVSQEEIEAAVTAVPEELKKAIQTAKENITIFHEAQKTSDVKVTTSTGVSCWQVKKPIDKIGLYIPGGSAPLFSTVLMLSIPAKIAGCKEIVLCTPPNKEGKINETILYAAQLCGVTKIFKVGGIQAIAAMTFGTETIPAVYKIFGPGNQFVTVAKQKATQFGVAIDMPAGPSELLVYGDETSNPNYIASDLLSQAEHGPDSQVILVSTDEKLLNAVEVALEDQLKVLPRVGIAEKAIENSKLIYVADQKTALDLINTYAPEHFIIASDAPEYFVENIENAGSVFIGSFTPESAGDYASGTNHTLPTNGFAKNYSGVMLDSYMKAISFQKITPEGLKNLGSTIEIMAQAEGLEAHKNAVSIRLKDIE